MKKQINTQKRQNIGISEEVHTKIKTYCSANKLKLNQYVEDVIIKHLEKVEE